MTDKVAVLDRAEVTKSKIRDIEPFLKWGAVAYGAGFLTVMLHTNRLGVPVMQLIEPIYIWVGAPLAVAGYFIEPLIAAFKRKQELLRIEMNEIGQYLDTLHAIKTPQAAAREAVKAFREILTIAPLGLVGLFGNKFLLFYLQKVLDKSLETADPEKARTYLIKFSSHVNFATRSVMAFVRFGLRLLPLAAIVIALVAYTVIAYPVIPQSLGGGKPSAGRLIIDVKKIPADDVNLQSLFPRSTNEKKITEAGAAASATVESRITCNLALQYQTEHAYYIKRGTGPIVVIDHDAVNGIIFASPNDSDQQGCI